MRTINIVERLRWFQMRLKPDTVKYSPNDMLQFISAYLNRFTIDVQSLKKQLQERSPSNKNTSLNASKKALIAMEAIIKQEAEEFDSCGLEVPDLMNGKDLKQLQEWDGSAIQVQHFRLKRMRRKNLEELICQQ